jgi:hypothetical protein
MESLALAYYTLVLTGIYRFVLRFMMIGLWLNATTTRPYLYNLYKFFRSAFNCVAIWLNFSDSFFRFRLRPVARDDVPNMILRLVEGLTITRNRNSLTRAQLYEHHEL